jgi:hypothetical protein
MKIWDNIRHVTRYYMPKFELFWICYKEERAIFLRGPKTYGSPCSSMQPINHCKRYIIRYTYINSLKVHYFTFLFTINDSIIYIA